MSLTLDIILYLILGVFGLETTRRVVRKFAPGVTDLYFDLIYLVILGIGAVLFLPKAIAERELREAQRKNEKALNTTQDELKNTKQLLDNTRIDQGKTATELTKAQKDLARAQGESENLRKENLALQADVLKLRARMADRNLNADQGNAVARKVSAFAGQVFSVVTLAGEGEHRNFALRLISILQSAGWRYDNKNRGILFAGSVGVFVDVAPTAPASMKKAGEVLTSALVAEGLRAAMTTDAGNNSDPTTILIRVAGRL